MIPGADPDTPNPDAGWVTIARLGRPRGNRGELTSISLSSKPERYQSLREVVLFTPTGSRAAIVESTWFHQATLIFKFQGIDTISDAETLAGAEVRVPLSQRAPLDPGEFFQSDLIGCQVFDRASGERLGAVADWEDSGGSGMLVLDDGLLIPFARAICVAIDVPNRRIEVELPPGLKELNRP